MSACILQGGLRQQLTYALLNPRGAANPFGAFPQCHHSSSYSRTHLAEVNRLKPPSIFWTHVPYDLRNFASHISEDCSAKKVPVICNIRSFSYCLPDLLNNAKTIALFLDYDGTLAPVSKSSKQNKMPPKTKEILGEIAKISKICTTVISGREIDDLKQRVGLANVNYSGNHGLQIEIAGRRHDFDIPEHLLDMYRELVTELNSEVSKNKSWVEDKKVSLTYHFGETPPDIAAVQNKRALEIIKKHQFEPIWISETSFEVMPPVTWNKGLAVHHILNERFGLDWITKGVKTLYVGDGENDESALQNLKGFGKSFRTKIFEHMPIFCCRKGT